MRLGPGVCNSTWMPPSVCLSDLQPWACLHKASPEKNLQTLTLIRLYWFRFSFRIVWRAFTKSANTNSSVRQFQIARGCALTTPFLPRTLIEMRSWHFKKLPITAIVRWMDIFAVLQESKKLLIVHWMGYSFDHSFLRWIVPKIVSCCALLCFYIVFRFSKGDWFTWIFSHRFICEKFIIQCRSSVFGNPSPITINIVIFNCLTT